MCGDSGMSQSTFDEADSDYNVSNPDAECIYNKSSVIVTVMIVMIPLSNVVRHQRGQALM